MLLRLGNAYTIELSRKMRKRPTFYIGRIRPYYQYGVSSGKESPYAQASSIDTCATMLDLSPRLKFGYVPAKPSDILTSFHQLVAERTLFPFIRQLGKGKLRPILLPI